MSEVTEILEALEEIQLLLKDIDSILVISGSQVSVNEGLSEISGSLGMISAGEFRTGKGAPGKGFFGMRMAWPAMSYDSEDWNLVGINDDTLQFGVRSSDGTLVAGAGAVTLDSSGITATAGTIGGWVLGADSLKDASGAVGMLSAVTGGDDIRFFAGHATPASAPFYVTEAGVLVASSATITGSITATTGAIGGWTVDATSISADSANISLDSSIPALLMGSATDYLTGRGVFIGSKSGYYKMHVGDPAGAHFRYDPVDPDYAVIIEATQLVDGDIVMHYAGNESIRLDNDGDAFFGSNTAAAATTSLVVLSNAQTYNSEALGAGDILLGDNSASKANILWDRSTGKLLFRGGTTDHAYINTSGNLIAGGGNVAINSLGIHLTGGTGTANSVSWVSGAEGAGDVFGHMYTNIIGSSPNRAADTHIHVVREGTGTPNFTIQATGSSVGTYVLSPTGHAFNVVFGADTYQFKYGVTGGAIFNNNGLDSDFRVESNGNANMLFVDGGANNVGIGTGAPNASGRLHVSYGSTINNAIANKGIILESDTSGAFNIITPNSNIGYINFGDPEDSNIGRILYVHATNYMRFDVNAAEALRISTTLQSVLPIKILEAAAAVADTAGYGQLWVKNTDPCELWFTDDKGTDTQIV